VIFVISYSLSSSQIPAVARAEGPRDDRCVTDTDNTADNSIERSLAACASCGKKTLSDETDGFKPCQDNDLTGGGQPRLMYHLASKNIWR